MKKILKLFSVLLVIILILISNLSYATDNFGEKLDTNITKNEMVIDNALDSLYTTSNNEIETKNEDDYIVESDVYLIQDNVSYEKCVYGNVYIIGENVNIASEYIEGNIFVIGGNAKIAGSISGSVYAIGKNVTLNATVAGSIYTIGEKIDINTTNVNSIYAIGSDLNLSEEARIKNDFKVIAKNLNIGGEILRELNALTENIIIKENTNLITKGSVSYSGECIDSTGKLNNVNLSKFEKEEKEEVDTVSAKITSELIKIATASFTIIIINIIVKNKNKKFVENYTKEILNGFFTGLIWIVIIPIMFFILVFTIIGTPISVIMIILYIIGLYISMPVAALKIARLFLREKEVNFGEMILYSIGAYIIIHLVSLIPVIGSLVQFVVNVFGFGILIKYLFNSKDKSNRESADSIVINE